MNLAEILTLKFPNANFVDDIIIRDDGDGPYIFKWDDSLGTKPTQAELDTWAVELTPLKEEQDIRESRRAEYPAIGDQLDAVLKQLNYMRMNNETDLVQDLDNIVNQWLAVKAKYPKAE